MFHPVVRGANDLERSKTANERLTCKNLLGIREGMPGKMYQAYSRASDANKQSALHRPPRD